MVSNHTRSLYAPAEAPLIFSKLSLEKIGEGFLNGEHDYHLTSCWEIHCFTRWGNGKKAAPVLRFTYFWPQEYHDLVRKDYSEHKDPNKMNRSAFESRDQHHGE